MTNKLTHFQKMDRLRSLYVRHCEKFGKLSKERYLGVLDGLDLAMELNESIQNFEKDLRNGKKELILLQRLWHTIARENRLCLTRRSIVARGIIQFHQPIT